MVLDQIFPHVPDIRDMFTSRPFGHRSLSRTVDMAVGSGRSSESLAENIEAHFVTSELFGSGQHGHEWPWGGLPVLLQSAPHDASKETHAHNSPRKASKHELQPACTPKTAEILTLHLTGWNQNKEYSFRLSWAVKLQNEAPLALFSLGPLLGRNPDGMGGVGEKGGDLGVSAVRTAKMGISMFYNEERQELVVSFMA